MEPMETKEAEDISSSPAEEHKEKPGVGLILLWIFVFPIMLIRQAVLKKQAGWWIFAVLVWLMIIGGSMFLLRPAVIEPIIKAQVTVALPDLSDEYFEYRLKPDIQKKEYRENLIGKKFKVRGKVKNVFNDGTLSLEIDDMDWNDFCLVKGVPREQLMKLNKGDGVSFSATVTRITDLVVFGIWLEYSPNYV